ncbi:carcinoembryonic antigen-related cell adhesion molecule 1-like isoform X2 [Hyperolius riggenbachi]|uniref:carcinoembryonic antigen-related cell adhesion molecule 1-like isoform X2 n=1 Tax=Hyperolius riggenbachi TaxID=752182 RepID=UPI0035A35892
MVTATLSSPTITAVPTDHPVEGTSVNLTCNAGNQAVHYYNFVSISAIIQCDTPRVSCSPSSSVLHFNPIEIQDNGYYACVIGNPVTQNVSDYLSIRVAVKVSNVTLTSNATRPITVEKDSVALICSSAGTNRSYSWTLMGSPLPQSSRYSFMDNNATLVISPVRRSDQGPFSCEVSNHLNREFSNPLNLTWSPDGQITCDIQRSGEILRLYCSWPGGYPAAQVNMAYGSNESTSLDEVISEIPHNQLPLGTVLSCTGMHEGYSEFCSVVIDTPQYPDFTNGSERAGREGSSVVLSVILSSGITGQRLQTHNTQVIPATFSWYHLDPVVSELMTGGNVSIISNDYASYLIVHHMTKDMIGRYMCKAENAIGSNSFTFVVNLTPEDSLSGGAIAGITIGSAAVLALVALTIALVCFMKKKDLRPKDEPHITTNLQGQIVTPNHYAHGQKSTGEGRSDSIYEEADGVYANCIK